MQKGIPVPELIERFFGKLEQWPVEPDNCNFTQANIRAICEHIHATGDCLWHAQYIVMKWEKCHCAQCMPPIPSMRQVAVVPAVPVPQFKRGDLVRFHERDLGKSVWAVVLSATLKTVLVQCSFGEIRKPIGKVSQPRPEDGPPSAATLDRQRRVMAL